MTTFTTPFIVVVLLLLACSQAHYIVPPPACHQVANSSTVVCDNLKDCSVLPRKTRSVLLKNSCSFQVEDWKNFTKIHEELELLKFIPDCKNCLKIDENFSNIKIEGRCLESNMKCKHHPKDELNFIADEIASCIILLIILTVLYSVKLIKKEIQQRLQ